MAAWYPRIRHIVYISFFERTMFNLFGSFRFLRKSHWFSGIILACHAGDPSSILGCDTSRKRFFFLPFLLLRGVGVEQCVCQGLRFIEQKSTCVFFIRKTDSMAEWLRRWTATNGGCSTEHRVCYPLGSARAGSNPVRIVYGDLRKLYSASSPFCSAVVRAVRRLLRTRHSRRTL